MVLEGRASGPKYPRSVAFRASTALLALALFGLSLRLSGAGLLLTQFSDVVALLLVRMAPVWALLGSLFATIYLVLSMWRPYSAAQHLAEMVAGVLLVVLMLPVF
jgi:hypothetical protein